MKIGFKQVRVHQFDGSINVIDCTDLLDYDIMTTARDLSKMLVFKGRIIAADQPGDTIFFCNGKRISVDEVK